MDDNAQCHRTVAAEQLLESEDIERMDWPARSPDLNPIEHPRLLATSHPPIRRLSLVKVHPHKATSNNLDMGWKNALRSISQRHPASCNLIWIHGLYRLQLAQGSSSS
ncbi:hypothetical protein TNCV_1339771 [Trichonephila clavipes]|uniref:Tc1-like transposase DDE domain-containing protein n=1 Tax=Trichonephila clavipes TaxID=2585209 RepID=A0A8X6UVF5_TRICX|nr:hypothetical protein TNCV_1339771 [Trichonephila clavipes]